MPTTGQSHRSRRRPSELVRRAFSKLVFRQAAMLRYEVRAGDSVAPVADCPYRIAFHGPEQAGAVARSNPYLGEEDLAELTSRPSVCIVVLDGDRVAASSWMTSGDVHVPELERRVVVPGGEHFLCRAFVDPAYRGRSLMSHMVHAYAGQVPPDDVLWGLVYAWNVASARSLAAAGWRPTAQYWTRVVLTRRFSGARPGPAVVA